VSYLELLVCQGGTYSRRPNQHLYRLTFAYVSIANFSVMVRIGDTKLVSSY